MVKTTGPQTKEVIELSTLLEISQTINSSTNIQQNLYAILDILAQKLGMTRGTVTLLKPHTDELMIEVAHGISPEAKKRGHYKVGEGITGQVVATGKPMVIPAIFGVSRKAPLGSSNPGEVQLIQA